MSQGYHRIGGDRRVKAAPSFPRRKGSEEKQVRDRMRELKRQRSVVDAPFQQRPRPDIL